MDGNFEPKIETLKKKQSKNERNIRKKEGNKTNQRLKNKLDF